MNVVIKTVSAVIVLLGIVHISFAFPIHMNEGTMWFVGSGFAIIFAGLLNLIAIDSGTKTSKAIAAVVNAMCCFLFLFFALPILNEPQVYVGIIIFAIATVCFVGLLIKKKKIQTETLP